MRVWNCIAHVNPSGASLGYLKYKNDQSSVIYLLMVLQYPTDTIVLHMS